MGRCVRVVRFRVFLGGVGGLDEFWLRWFVGCAMGAAMRDSLGFPTPLQSFAVAKAYGHTPWRLQSFAKLALLSAVGAYGHSPSCPQSSVIVSQKEGWSCHEKLVLGWFSSWDWCF